MADVTVVKEAYQVGKSEVYSICLLTVKKFKVLIDFDIFKKPYLAGTDGKVNMTGIKYHDFLNASLGTIKQSVEAIESKTKG